MLISTGIVYFIFFSTVVEDADAESGGGFALADLGPEDRRSKEGRYRIGQTDHRHQLAEAQEARVGMVEACSQMRDLGTPGKRGTGRRTYFPKGQAG